MLATGALGYISRLSLRRGHSSSILSSANNQPKVLCTVFNRLFRKLNYKFSRPDGEPKCDSPSECSRRKSRCLEHNLSIHRLRSPSHLYGK